MANTPKIPYKTIHPASYVMKKIALKIKKKKKTLQVQIFESCFQRPTKRASIILNSVINRNRDPLKPENRNSAINAVSPKGYTATKVRKREVQYDKSIFF